MLVANTIKIKQSSTASNVPAAGDLVQGELAINTTDKILWSKDGAAVFQLTFGDHAGLYLGISANAVSATLASTVTINASNSDVWYVLPTRDSTSLYFSDSGNSPEVNMSTGDTRFKDDIYPKTDNTGSCGLAAYTWNDGYFTNATIGVLSAATITTPKLDEYSILHTNATPTGTTQTCAYGTSQSHHVDLESVTGNVTITLSGGPPSGTYGEMKIMVTQDSTTWRTITWAGGTFKWPGGTAPVLSTIADAVDVYHFFTIDEGTTWHGTSAQDFS